MSNNEDRIVVSNSAIETAQACPTRYYWNYVKRQILVNKVETAPLDFGLAIHQGLEVRGRGEPLEQAIKAFKELFPVDLTPKHTVKAGTLILKEYYSRYGEDYEIVKNEYPFLIDLGEFVFKGRLDKLVKYDNKLVVMDHKTTSDLGESFYNMTKPNGQFTGYIYAANCEFGEIDTLIVDGILVPKVLKTKPLETNFERVVTTRTDVELEMWEHNVRGIVKQIKQWGRDKQWPRYDRGYNCSGKWNECAYRNLCLMVGHPEDIEPPQEIYKFKEEKN